jgi:hypothetical protein
MTFLQQIIVRRPAVNTRGTPAAASPRGRHLTLATIGVLAPWMMSGGTLTPSRAGPSADGAPRTADAAVMPIGERLVYDVKFGAIKVGTGAMEVREVDDVRGRDAWHTIFTIKGGVPLYKVDDRMESWIDTASFTSLRFVQEYPRGPATSHQAHRAIPGAWRVRRRGNDAVRQANRRSTARRSGVHLLPPPLPDGQSGRATASTDTSSPIAIPSSSRSCGASGSTCRPARSRRSSCARSSRRKASSPRTGQAEVWLTDDARHAMVQMKAKLSFGSLTLQLKSVATAVVD